MGSGTMTLKQESYTDYVCKIVSILFHNNQKEQDTSYNGFWVADNRLFVPQENSILNSFEKKWIYQTYKYISMGL